MVKELSDLFRFAELAPAGQDLALRKLAHRLDRLTARFACVVIAATGVIFTVHLGRYLIRAGVL